MNLKPAILKKAKPEKQAYKGAKVGWGESAEGACAKALRQKHGNMLKSVKGSHCGKATSDKEWGRSRDEVL